MNSLIMCENFVIKSDEDSLSVTEIRTDPEGIKCEIKEEPEECYKAFEHIDIKHETSHHMVSRETFSEVESVQDHIEFYEEVSQVKHEHGEEGENNVIPVLNGQGETYEPCLWEEKCGVPLHDHRGQKANTHNICSNSVFRQNYHQMCTKTAKTHIKCDVCSKSLSNNNNIYKQSKHTASNFCKKSFYNQTNEKLFPCIICTKPFINKSNLTGTHVNERQFTCDVCDQKYKSLPDKSSMHSTLILTNEHQFSCNVCAKSFSRRSSLVQHTRVHRTNQLFTCDICAKSFRNKSSLIQHVRIHTNDKPFSCNFCTKSFSQLSNLNKHTRVHVNEKSFTCNICTKSFRYKSTLVHHLYTHSSEKPFICIICTKSFSQKSHLAGHARTHTNEKPFTCNFCTKSFNDKSNLIKHIRTHTRQ